MVASRGKFIVLTYNKATNGRYLLQNCVNGKSSMIKCCLFTAPSPGFGGASPSPLGYQPSPSNTTPSPLGYSPMTPGGAPFTPGTGMDQSMADWHTTEIEVKIKETHDDHKLIHQTGIIRSVTVSITNKRDCILYPAIVNCSYMYLPL